MASIPFQPRSAVRPDGSHPRLGAPPLVPLVAAMALGIAIDRWLGPFETATWITLAMMGATAGCVLIRREFTSSLGVLAAVLAMGGGWHHFWWFDLPADDISESVSEQPSPAWVRGVITQVIGLRTTEGYGEGDPGHPTTRMVMALTEISDGTEWRAASGGTLLVAAGDRRDLRPGRHVEVAGQLARVAGPLNPGEFDYREHLRAQGIRLRLTTDEPSAIAIRADQPDWPLTRWLGAMRGFCHSRLNASMDPRTAPLASALILGQRDEIDPELNDAFARTGTTHLLAISGLQLQALAFFLSRLLRLTFLPRRLIHASVAILTIAYAILVGFAPSVVRSAVMTGAFCLAAMVGRPSSAANTLALAGLATLAWNPLFLFDVGCQLSFLAIAALVWMVPRAQRTVLTMLRSVTLAVTKTPAPIEELKRKFEPVWKKFLRKAGGWLVLGIVGSTVVWLAALPLVALRFHLVSPIGVFLNLPLIPITSLALLLGAFGLGLQLVWAPLGALPLRATDLLLRLTEAIVRWGVDQPWGHWFVAGPAPAWVLVFYLMLFLAVAVAVSRMWKGSERFRPAKLATWLLAVATMAPGWIFLKHDRSNAPVAGDLLAVGHGLAAIIQTPDSSTLYDCGRMGDPKVARRIIAPALWSRGITKLDRVYLSHADQDHFNALPDLLDRFRIKEVVIPAGFLSREPNPDAIKLLDLLAQRRVPVRPIAAFERWDEHDVRFTVLHPPNGWQPEASDNAHSLVLDVAVGRRHLLLTGDLDEKGIDALIDLPHPEGTIDLMLSPHHGGKTANPPRLYEWAEPRAVMVSQRPPPSPTGDVLRTLEADGISVLRTWRHGALHFEVKRDSVATHGFLDRYPPESEGGTREYAMVEMGGMRLIPAVFLVIASTPAKLVIGAMGFLLGLLAVAIVTIVEFGAWALICPPRAKTEREPEAAGAAETARDEQAPAISVVADDGAVLQGDWLPTGIGPGVLSCRTVLLLHGFADSAWQMAQDRADALRAGGWNVAAVDLRGYGRSEGRYASFGGREVDDVRKWLDLIERKTSNDAALEIVVWGRSMGAAVALRAAAADDRIRGLILESPLVDLNASLAVWFRQRKIPGANSLARWTTRRAGKLAGVSLTRPGPLESARLVRCPTLILHGRQDRLVPATEVDRFISAFHHAPKIETIPRAGHSDLMVIGGRALCERIGEFLAGIQ